MAQTTEYKKDLIKASKDPTEPAAYLNAALEEGDRGTFLLALRNVAEANGGMGRWRPRLILTEKACLVPCHVEEIRRSAPCLICCTG